MLNNLAKAHIKPSLIYWSPFEGFHSRLLKPCFQNIYGSNLPNSVYTILRIRDLDLDPYSTVYFHWPKSIDNFFLGYISSSYINIDISIVTTILMTFSAALFWCEAPAPLNPIFCCLFNISSINYEVLNISFSILWYALIVTPWLLSSLFNKIL